MTNYNERLDEILDDIIFASGGSSHKDCDDACEMKGYYNKAKQAITSLIKELVEEAKPDAFKFDDGQNDATHFYNKAASDYQQNLLKALEE